MGEPKLIGWASLAAEVREIRGRLEALERDSHPPIDLTPAMDELLEARGYAPRRVCDPDKQTATPSPVESAFDLGRDIHGREVRLVEHRDYTGRPQWRLDREPANQRDERIILDGLTARILKNAASIVEGGK